MSIYAHNPFASIAFNATACYGKYTFHSPPLAITAARSAALKNTIFQYHPTPGLCRLGYRKHVSIASTPPRLLVRRAIRSHDSHLF